MPRPPRRLPAQNTLSYLLLTLTALCGEYPISQISRLPGGPAYLENVVTALRRDGLLCDAYNTTELGEEDCTRLFLMDCARFPAWLAERQNSVKTISDF